MAGPILARDIMVTTLITLSPEMKLRDAAKLLLKNRISGAPVVNEKGDLIGIFSERDVMSALIDAVYDHLPSSEVRSYMSQDLHTIHEDLHLLSIAHIFQSKGLRRLPVVRDKHLVGQISRRDVMAAVLKLLEPATDRKAAILYLSALREPPEAPLD
ncbi:MAG: CBS domain-containing protein [Pirellulales bacterium]